MGVTERPQRGKETAKSKRSYGRVLRIQVRKREGTSEGRVGTGACERLEKKIQPPVIFHESRTTGNEKKFAS